MLRNVVKWFEKEGADAWYKHTPEELLPAGTKCSCGATKWRKENDILDVWFDSGSSHLAVLKGPEWPADVYLEGPDQYRGWFHSSLLIGIGIRKNPPYKGVVTHGWTLDEKGQPMSKSLGNTLYPAEICERWGADLLRLWVASVEYQADVKMSERVMTQLSDAYRKIRNTFRYGLSNLADFDYARRCPTIGWMKWMLDAGAYTDLVKKCREWYAGMIFIASITLFTISVSSISARLRRIEVIACIPRPRRATAALAVTAVWKITGALVRLSAPIMVFTAEEIWKYLPKTSGDHESVHMALFSEEQELRAGIASKQVAVWELLSKVRGEVLKALEAARNEKKINSGLEAKVLLNAELLKAKLKQHLPCFRGCLLFRRWILTAGTRTIVTTDSGLEVTIQKADGANASGVGIIRPMLAKTCVIRRAASAARRPWWKSKGLRKRPRREFEVRSEGRAEARPCILPETPPTAARGACELMLEQEKRF